MIRKKGLNRIGWNRKRAGGAPVLRPLIFLLVAGLYLYPAAAWPDESWFERGISYLRSKQYDKAVDAFSKVIEHDPNHVSAYNNRGIALYRKTQYDLAIADYTKALELNPAFDRAYTNRGAAWQHKGNVERALADYNKALELNPHQPFVYNNRGLLWQRKGDYDRAIADYEKAIEMNPRYAQAYCNRGAAWHLKGDYDQALADYGRAVELNPRHAGAFNNRGLIYLRKGGHDQAIGSFTRAIGINPGYADAYSGRAMAYYEKGVFGRAIADFTKAIEIMPQYAEVHNRLAWILATCPEARYRDGAGALTYAKRAVALKAEPSFMDTLAACYAEVGRFDDAVATQKKVIALLTKADAHQDLSGHRERLAAYEARRPWRVGPPPVSSRRAQRGQEPLSGEKKGRGGEVRRPFTIQVSSYRDREQANRIAATLQEKGHSAFASHARIPGKGDWYRIFIGCYPRLEAARAAAEKLRRENIRHTLVIKLPYAVQVGLADTVKELLQLKERLRLKGYTAYSLPDPGQQGKMRLLLGAFYTREMASGLSRELQQAGFSPEIVLR